MARRTIKHVLIVIVTTVAAQDAAGAATGDQTVQPNEADSSIQHAPAAHEPLDTAWWTGPLYASTPATLPRGHFDIAPFLYDIISYGEYDSHSSQKRSSTTHHPRNLWFLMYGVTDTFMVDLLPTVGYPASGSQHGTSLESGDISIRLQQRLAAFQEGRHIPTISVALEQRFPTGRFDELRDPGAGMGCGCYETTLSLYSQYIFRVPNGRILRARLNLSRSFADAPVDTKDVSVYGTTTGFRGRARPGDVTTIDLALEYSVKQSLALALDVVSEHHASTWVNGSNTTGSAQQKFFNPIRLQSGSGDSLTLAPALEMSRTAYWGVLIGVAGTVSGRNTSATITPIVAVNYAY